MFLLRKSIMSTFFGFILFCFLFTNSLAYKKSLSDSPNVAGTHKYFHAKGCRVKNWDALAFHQFIGTLVLEMFFSSKNSWHSAKASVLKSQRSQAAVTLSLKLPQLLVIANTDIVVTCLAVPLILSISQSRKYNRHFGNQKVLCLINWCSRRKCHYLLTWIKQCSNCKYIHWFNIRKSSLLSHFGF